MKTKYTLEENINLFAPQKQTHKVNWALVSVLSIVVFALGAAMVFPILTGNSNYAVAKGIDKENGQFSTQDTLLAQQSLGDDFYRQASGEKTTAQSKPATQNQKQSTSQKQVASAQLPAKSDMPAQTTPASKQKKAEVKPDADKLVTVDITNVGRANPFVPTVNVPGYYDLGLPKPLPKSSQFPEPPTQFSPDNTAIKLMETTISGIMYDTFSPSAIIRVEGQDHLVKKGDRINGYKIVNITKDRVVVQNGTNVYRATVGETLTSQGNIHFNTIDNLEQKFGGARMPADSTLIHIN